MLRGRRRIFVLAGLALAIPLPALALEGGNSEAPTQGTPAPQALSVSTSLGECGVGEATVFCTLNVSFNAIDGATSYSATVTRADGSVVDYGSVGAGGTSLYVPYVGPGNYSVRVSAYGSLPTEEGEETKDPGNEKDTDDLIATDEDGAGKETDDPRVAGNALPDNGAGAAGGHGSIGNAASDESPGADEAADGPAPVAPPPCQPAPTPPPPELPPLPEPPPPDTDPNNPDEDADGILDADEQVAYDQAVAERAAAEAAAAAAQPQSVECPAQQPAGP